MCIFLLKQNYSLALSFQGMLCYILARDCLLWPQNHKGNGQRGRTADNVRRNHTPSCFKEALSKVTLRCPLSLPKKRQVTVTYSNSTSQFQTDHISHAAFCKRFSYLQKEWKKFKKYSLLFVRSLLIIIFVKTSQLHSNSEFSSFSVLQSKERINKVTNWQVYEVPTHQGTLNCYKT